MALSCLALTCDPCSCSPVVSSHPNDALFETGLQCLESQEANMSFVGPLFHDLCCWSVCHLRCCFILDMLHTACASSNTTADKSESMPERIQHKKSLYSVCERAFALMTNRKEARYSNTCCARSGTCYAQRHAHNETVSKGTIAATTTVLTRFPPHLLTDGAEAVDCWAPLACCIRKLRASVGACA